MTITTTLLTSGADDSDANSRVTNTITPAPLSLIVAFALSAGSTTAPDNTWSGLGLTFVEQVTVAGSGGARKLTLTTAQCGSSPGSGALTISAPASIVGVWAVIEVLGHDPAAPVVQTATDTAAGSTGEQVTLGAGSGADNRAFAAFAHRAATASTPGTNWTELSDNTAAVPATGLMTEWRSDAFEAAALASWATNSAAICIAVEIAAAPPPARRVFYRRP